MALALTACLLASARSWSWSWSCGVVLPLLAADCEAPVCRTGYACLLPSGSARRFIVWRCVACAAGMGWDVPSPRDPCLARRAGIPAVGRGGGGRREERSVRRGIRARAARSALCAVLGPPHPSPQLVRLSVTHWINGNIACCLSHTDISTTTQIDIKRPPACTHARAARIHRSTPTKIKHIAFFLLFFLLLFFPDLFSL